MIWTRRLMQTAFIFLVTLTVLTNESKAEIRTLWVPLPRIEAMRLSRLESDGSRLYAGTENGLYISNDNGVTWRLTEMTHFINAMAISDDAVYAFVYEHGMFRSDDYGETWNPINNGLHKIDDRTGEIRLPSFHQMLVASSGMVIAVGYHDGTYISRDRGETWRYPLEEWVFDGPFLSTYIAWDTWSMTEFDGYLWSACHLTNHQLYRTPDDGGTWELLPEGGNRLSMSDYDQVDDWAVHDDRLYVAARKGIARWDEGELAWDDLTEGLPTGHDPSHVIKPAVNRGRLFAGTRDGVYMFNERSKTWRSAGLQDFIISKLVSHQSNLYAVTYANNEPQGILRASIPIVNPYGKSATTWGALKRQ